MNKNRNHIIVDLVCDELEIPIDIFLSPKRKPEYVEARWIASRLIQKIYPKITHEEIEYIIRGKDYQGWVNFSNRRFDQNFEIYTDFASKYNRVKRRVLTSLKNTIICELNYNIKDVVYFYDDYSSLPIKAILIDYDFEKSKWIAESLNNGKLFFKSDYELFN